jgi:hypothetical protein
MFRHWRASQLSWEGGLVSGDTKNLGPTFTWTERNQNPIPDAGKRQKKRGLAMAYAVTCY